MDMAERLDVARSGVSTYRISTDIFLLFCFVCLSSIFWTSKLFLNPKINVSAGGKITRAWISPKANTTGMSRKKIFCKLGKMKPNEMEPDISKNAATNIGHPTEHKALLPRSLTTGLSENMNE